MLEYDIDEAQALLEKNLSTATKNLDSLEEDLDFLRDQFTTTEVSILSLKRSKRRKHSYLYCFNEKSVLIFRPLTSFGPGPPPVYPGFQITPVSYYPHPFKCAIPVAFPHFVPPT